MLKRAFQLLLVVSLAWAAAWAKDDPFVGSWKLNPSKSVLTDVMKVESQGGNRYAFDLGGGIPENIVVDGTDQPGVFGTTLAVGAEGQDRWKVVRKKDGKVIVTGIWTLSKDGTSLTDHFTAFRPSGDIYSLDYVYKRTEGGSGFAGTWESASEQVNSAYVVEVKTYEGDGLSFINSGGAGTKNVKFDGKDYANAGAVVDGVACSARRVNERTVEMTDKISGRVVDMQEISVSDDGNTLTMTVHAPGRTKPNVLVFERQ